MRMRPFGIWLDFSSACYCCSPSQYGRDRCVCPSGMLPHGRSDRDTFRCNKSDWVDGDGDAGALVLVRLFHNELKFAGTRIII